MVDVNVADLKARLSEFLRRVRAGGEVVVYDRDLPIARIVPYAPRGALVVREPAKRYRTLGQIAMPPAVRLGVDPVALLLEDRQSDR